MSTTTTVYALTKPTVAGDSGAWGGMLNSSRLYIDLDAWLSIFPGLAIMIVVLGFNFLGDGLRDILDPRLGPHVGGASDKK